MFINARTHTRMVTHSMHRVQILMSMIFKMGRNKIYMCSDAQFPVYVIHIHIDLLNILV